ncbi:ribonuclease H-like domain-containing protein [Tanacetum coccineum]
MCGTLSRYKARLVANGSTQVEGVDVDETFSPVVKPGTIRTVLSLVASRHWLIHQLDVKNAFLHGDLSETIYMHQPSGFWDSTHPDYGIDTAYLLLYVDDIVLTASSKGLLQRIIGSLHQEFAMTYLGPLNYFLGISVTRDSSGLFLSQKKYAIEILEKEHMFSCNPSRLHVDTEYKLVLMVDTQVCLHMHDPREPHLFTLKRILRYVQGTLNYGLQLFSSSTSDLVAYFDADWAGCPTTRRSTSGAVYLSCNPVQHQRTKHIEIDIYFIRDLVVAGQVCILHVPSRYQFVDIFTKGLPSALFEEFRSSLSVRCSPNLTAGEC